jgi:hypothetical protein
MNKISARDIQLFVGGALALTGFRALIWLPYYVAVSMDSVRIAASIISGLALLMGIGILMSRAWAIWLAQIYLWLVVISGCIAIPILWHFFPEKGGCMALGSAPDMVVSIMLLILIYWSRSRRFQTSNKSLQATAAAPSSCD